MNDGGGGGGGSAVKVIVPVHRCIRREWGAAASSRIFPVAIFRQNRLNFSAGENIRARVLSTPLPPDETGPHAYVPVDTVSNKLKDKRDLSTSLKLCTTFKHAHTFKFLTTVDACAIMRSLRFSITALCQC